MARQTTHRLQKRRKREGKTNYRKRLSLLLSHKPRLVVRKRNSNITVQIIEYQPGGDIVRASAHSKELKSFGYTGNLGNSKAGYLVGLLGGKRSIKEKIKSTVLDMGLASPVKGSVIFSALLGAIEGGLDVPHNSEILPPREYFSDLEQIRKKIIKGA